MVDPALLRTQPDNVRQAISRKGYSPELVDAYLGVDADLRSLQGRLQELQAKRNHATQEMAQASEGEREERRESLRALSNEVQDLAEEERRLTEVREQAHRAIPNLPQANWPDGKDDTENVEVKVWGSMRQGGELLDHEVICQRLDLLDMERGARLAGSKWYYLRNELVLLEQAVLRWTLDEVRKRGFTLLTVPHAARPEAFLGAGYATSAADLKAGEFYTLEQDDLILAGTAEVGLVNFHAGELVDVSDPVRLAAISPCYRREAGAAGRESRGLYRVHQFHKVEMVSLTRPEASENEHTFLLEIAESLLQQLGIAYRVVQCCTGDLGHPQVAKWDIEAWLPGMQKYGETHSCSNDTDFQARALRIQHETGEGRGFVHTLNNTALASPRILIALLETFQQVDGERVWIEIPEVLRSYTGFDKIG